MEKINKPKQLRAIFILNALMIALPFLFYLVFTTQDIIIGTLDPIWMVYTGIGYIISFAMLVATILNRKIILMRLVFALNILISIPVGAYIGILVAVISFALSYHKNVKAFFGSTITSNS
ncbi:MAG: hypothetical protein ED557_05780 [Balneola sp.]|nr:MAG: hypothetical protein ED557_05780 [Balneola sp.]